MIDLGDVVALLRCCVVGARGRAGDLKSEREGIRRDCRTAIVPDTKITVTEACSSSIAGIAKGIENVSLLWTKQASDVRD